jgi:hypothetical protein
MIKQCILFFIISNCISYSYSDTSTTTFSTTPVPILPYSTNFISSRLNALDELKQINQYSIDILTSFNLYDAQYNIIQEINTAYYNVQNFNTIMGDRNRLNSNIISIINKIKNIFVYLNGIFIQNINEPYISQINNLFSNINNNLSNLFPFTNDITAQLSIEDMIIPSSNIIQNILNQIIEIYNIALVAARTTITTPSSITTKTTSEPINVNNNININQINTTLIYVLSSASIFLIISKIISNFGRKRNRYLNYNMNTDNNICNDCIIEYKKTNNKKSKNNDPCPELNNVLNNCIKIL